jgi:thioredoxin-related protein
MKRLLFLLICPPFFVSAQKAEAKSGIDFITSLTWEQVIEKARADHKYIFVDCYATWCGPCKKMDKEVFQNEAVAIEMSENFIAVKIQLDSTKEDNEDTRRLSSSARFLEKEFKVRAIPTYLFFTPDAKIVHRAMGYIAVADFVQLLKDATRPDKQLYTRFNDCMSGKLEYIRMPQVISMLKEQDQDSLALLVGNKYLHEYIYKLSDAKLISEENLKFLSGNAAVLTSHDRIFWLCLNRPKEVDAAINLPGFAKGLVSRVINREIIGPQLAIAERKGSKPDWKYIRDTILKRYHKDFVDLVSVVKVKYYNQKKDWNKYLLSLQELWKIKKGIFSEYSWTFLNDIAWNVCVHSNKRQHLELALTWISLGISRLNTTSSAMLDTKANILYQLGRQSEAILNLKLAIQSLKGDEGLGYSNEDRQSLINSKIDLINKMAAGEEIILAEEYGDQ